MAGSGIDFGRFDALTFDCYGTLIDWERGIVETLAPVISRAGAVDRDGVLEIYARNEAALESGEDLPYAEIVSRSMSAVCAELGVEAGAGDRERFARSVGTWPPFDDSPDALR